VKLPFSKPSSQTQPELVSPPWQTLVLVCSKCKGARGGPDPRDIRKGLKHRLGKPKSLRVVEVECLQICPERAVTVCVVGAATRLEVLTIESEDALDALAGALAKLSP